MHFGGSIFLMAMFLWNSAPVVIYRSMKAEEDDQKQREKLAQKEKTVAASDSSNPPKVAPKTINLFDKKEFRAYSKYLISDGWFSYHAIYLLFSFIGIVHPIFYVFHMLDLSLRSPTVRNVLKAVTVNGHSILLMTLLEAFLVYIYSAIGFLWFKQDYTAEEGLNCDRLSTCVVSTFNIGIRSGGGIGDALNKLDYHDPMYIPRLFFDIAFWATIIVIGLNMVFGIILDTFGELRDKKNAIDEDMNSKCFLCGIDSDTFQRLGYGFKHHTEHEHSVWVYLYFFIHLDMKDQDEYTTLETYIANKREKGEIEFFPVEKSISILE